MIFYVLFYKMKVKYFPRVDKREKEYIWWSNVFLSAPLAVRRALKFLLTPGLQIPER